MVARWRVLSAACYESGTLAKYAKWMVAHWDSCLMTWRKRDTVICRHGVTSTRSPVKLVARINGYMVTSRQRNIWRHNFTATRSTGKFVGMEIRWHCDGRLRDTVTWRYGFTATRSTGDLVARTKWTGHIVLRPLGDYVRNIYGETMTSHGDTVILRHSFTVIR